MLQKSNDNYFGSFRQAIPRDKTIQYDPRGLTQQGDGSPLTPEKFIYSYFQKPIKEQNMGQDWICSGQKGSGKSTVTMSFALLLDHQFDMAAVAFTADEWLDIIQNLDDHGFVIVWEEVGTKDSMSSRQFMKKANQQLSDVLQTYRTMRLLNIWNVPDESFLDVRGRKLRRGKLVPVRKLKYMVNGELCMFIRCKFYIETLNPITGKTKNHFFKYNGQRIVTIDIPHPPQEFWDEYQAKRNDVPLSLAKEINNNKDIQVLRGLKKIKETDKEKKKMSKQRVDNIIAEISADLSPFLKKGAEPVCENLVMYKIEKKYSVDWRTSKMIKALLIERSNNGVVC